MDKRIEKSTRSILALKDLLRDVCLYPDKFKDEEEIVKSLKSQYNLAKLSIYNKGIFPSSINSLKRNAEGNLDGGFNALDNLRKTASAAMEAKFEEGKLPDKQTKTGLLLTIKKIESEKQLLREDLLIITLALEKALRQGYRYAEHADSNTLEKCKKEQRELLDIISKRKLEITTNVVKLREN